jgi:uncharacterized membrane protein
MFKVPWRAVSALALLTAIGCGDDGGSEPEGSISVSGSPTTLSVPQGGSGTVTVTLTRGGGFGEPVNVTVEGLPSGVTASVAPTSLTGTTTQAVLTVTVTNSVAAGSYTATIRASAAGIGAATTTFVLTVTAQAAYTLTATAASAVPGASGTSTIAIQRTNFTGPVTLTLENPPAGITGTFNPTPANGDQSVLTINVAPTVAPGTYNLTVKGAATGPGEKTTTVALTVTAAPTYTLSVTPTTLPINAGDNGQATVNIARANFDGTVTLSLDAPPAGITATFNPAGVTGPTAIATINVAANVAPGNHPVTIKGTAAGTADKTTILTVTVAAAGTFTISAAPTALTIAPGANLSSTITIARTNLTSDVVLSLVTPPTGITGTFTPATLTGTTLTSALQINVAANVAPGTYPITVRGVGGSVTQTTTVNVTVAAAGSTVTLAVAPTTLSITAGSSGQTTLTATRSNFTGDITPSVTGNPAGMTVAFNPTPITTSPSTVTVNVGAGVVPGTYNLTITGAAGTAGNPTTTLGVTVTAAGGGQNIVWEFCNADGVPLKFWRQSGGTWAEVSPTVVGAVTRFSFTISGTQAGIAYTSTVTDASVRSSPRVAKSGGSFGQPGLPVRRKLMGGGAARLTNQTGSLLATYFDTFVMLALTSEIATRQPVCTTPTPPAPVTKTFTVSGMASNEIGLLSYGDGSASLTPATASYGVSVTPGTYDWLAAFGIPGPIPDFPTFTHYRLGRGETAPGGTVAINRTGATPFTTVPFTITGGSAGSANIYVQFFEGARGPIAGLTFGDPTSNAGNLLFLATGDRLATDMNIFFNTNAEGTEFEIQRGFIRSFGPNPPASTTFALPANVPAFTVAPVNGAPVPTWSASGQIPTDYQGVSSFIEASFQGAGESTLYTITATRGWLTANNMSTSYTLAGPTLPGFLAQWAPATPLVDAQVVMASSLDLFAGTAGSVVNFALRFVFSP